MFLFVFSYLHLTVISTLLEAFFLVVLLMVSVYIALSVLFTLRNVIDVYVSVTFAAKRPLYAVAIFGTLSEGNLSTMSGVSLFPNQSRRNDPSPKLYLHSRVILLPSTGINVFGGSAVNFGSLPIEK